MLKQLVLLGALLWPALSAADPVEAPVRCGDSGAISLKQCQALAESGNADAQEALGTMHLNGDGAPEDIAQAAEWLTKAADQDNVAAQYSLGLLHLMGMGVPQDYVQAHLMFNLGAASGYDKAAESREEVKKLMTPPQIEEAQRLAREWMEKHKKKQP